MVGGADVRVSRSISRREVLWGVPFALLATRARAQRAPKVIGILSPYGTADVEPALLAFRQAMRDLGYPEGPGFTLIQRLADGHQERLPALANAATSTIPIVFESVADPVAAGIAKSINRPGRNVTGLSNFSIDLSPKRFQRLTQLLPALREVEVLANPLNAYYATQKPAIESVADKLGLRVNFADASTPEEIEQAFRTMAARRALALIVTADGYFYARRQQIATLALNYRLATVFPFGASVDAGGLMSYGVDPAPAIRQAAVFVDKIFKGANPGDLPIEQPTRIEMVINRRTAALLRLTIPPALLLQAERVID